MPEVQRRATVPLRLAQVWPYVADMNRWAADVPGYRAHRMLSERESVWRLTGDMGMLSREVEVNVLITEWREPSHVAFTLHGLEEPVTGEGTFSMEQVNDEDTSLSFSLTLTAAGSLAPVINVLLKTFMARVADQFIETLRERLLAQAQGSA